jgi:tRNA threonylcarbamoyladenosine biosynthesis protein TsaB
VSERTSTDSPVRALAIETSSRTGSIAAVEDGSVRAEEQFEHGLQHAAQIIPIIDRLCRGQGGQGGRGWTPRDLDELYVSAGPGSFTGLRIGITLAKTFSFATGAKLVAVPTVRVLVENAPPEARHVVLVLDAKREQIFTARFERACGEQGDRGDAGAWIEREPAHLDSLTNMLERAPRPVHLLGEGLPFHEKFIPRADADAGVIVTPAELWRPRARVVAQIGGAMARAGEFSDPDRFAPIYLRKPEAQEKWEARNRMLNAE